MAQVSNVQSRTLRVLGALPESVKATLSQKGAVVLEKESYLKDGKIKSFVSAEEIKSVVELLAENNLVFRPHFYSLFVKFSNELKTGDVEKLNEKIYAITPDAEISYSRVDSNGHTGKIVVDRFEDYNTLRASSGDMTFFKFNRTKAQTRGGAQPRPAPSTGGAAPVQRTVSAPVDSEGFELARGPRPGRQSRPRGAAQSAAGGSAPRGRGRPAARGRPAKTPSATV
jgi:hypothetical protein